MSWIVKEGSGVPRFLSHSNAETSHICHEEKANGMPSAETVDTDSQKWYFYKLDINR